MTRRTTAPAVREDPWGQVSTLVAGPVAWGAIGYGVDAAAGTSAFLPAGLVLGILAATWLVVRRHLAAVAAEDGPWLHPQPAPPATAGGNAARSSPRPTRSGSSAPAAGGDRR